MFDKNEQAEYEEQIKEAYLKSEQMSFVMAALSPYLNDLFRDKSAENIEQMIEAVTVKHEDNARLCPVPGSIAVARKLQGSLPGGNSETINIAMPKKQAREELMHYLDR